MDPVSRPIFRSFHVSEDHMSFFTALVTSKIAAGVLAGGALAAGGTVAAHSGTPSAPPEQGTHAAVGATAADEAGTEHNAGVPDTADAAVQPESGAGAGDEAVVASGGKNTARGDGSNTSGATPSHDKAAPAGPDATGPAAYGLCTAFTKGGLDTSSVAYQSLSAAAGGTGSIGSYCETVAAPGESASHGPGTSGNSAAPHTATPQKPANAQAGLAHKPSTAGGGLSNKPSKAGKP
jgi:hypothetical protein